MMDVIDWCNTKPFTKEEKDVFYQFSVKAFEHAPIKDSKYIESKRLFLEKYLPFSKLNPSNCEITVDQTETLLINKVKEKLVDENTLVVSSDQEHPSVENMVKSCSHYYIMNYVKEITMLNYSKLMEVAKDYNKIVFIINGIKVQSGAISPQIFFTKLRQIFANKDITLILDDAQGLILTPRDYSIFDYVLATCHAIVTYYNAGLCISIGKCKDKPLGVYNSYVIDGYSEGLNPVVSRMDKMNCFKLVLDNYFYESIVSSKLYITNNLDIIKSPTALYIFNLEDKHKIFSDSHNQLLKQFEIGIDGNASGAGRRYLRMRGQQFLDSPDNLLKGLKVIDEILNNF